MRKKEPDPNFVKALEDSISPKLMEAQIEIDRLKRALAAEREAAGVLRDSCAQAQLKLRHAEKMLAAIRSLAGDGEDYA